MIRFPGSVRQLNTRHCEVLTSGERIARDHSQVKEYEGIAFSFPANLPNYRNPISRLCFPSHPRPFPSSTTRKPSKSVVVADL